MAWTTFGSLASGNVAASLLDANFNTVLGQSAQPIGSVSGSANAITGTTSPVLVLAAGQVYTLTPGAANTSAVTLALNGGAAKNVYAHGAALVGGELQNGVPKLLVYDGTKFNIVGGGTRVVRQVFTVSGTYTPTVGMVYADVELQAGGGSGGGCAASVYAGASGGSAGGYVKKLFDAATIGASQTVTLGAAGTAPSAGANPGNAASDSTFGALLTAKGGAAGNAGSSAAVVQGVDGQAGTSSGDWSVTGGPSLPGVGGSASVPSIGGKGGDSQLGRGGRGISLLSGNIGGTAGSGYGSGGGGAVNGNSGSAVAGAAGQAAICIVTEYVSG